MRKRQWRAILGRYGRKAVVRTPGREDMVVKALIQPVLDKNPQLVPSPMGLRSEERAVWLGPGDVTLHPGESVVCAGEELYEVRSARVVGNGHHVWAMLQRMEGEA